MCSQIKIDFGEADLVHSNNSALRSASQYYTREILAKKGLVMAWWH